MEKEPRFEVKQEHVPTAEEIHAVFKELIKGEYKEVRKREDEQGVYLLEVLISGDKQTDRTEYEYMRAGQYKEGASIFTEIHKVYYELGDAVGGELVAKFVDGKWEIL